MRFFRLYDDGRNYVLLRLAEEHGVISGPNNMIMFKRNAENRINFMYCDGFGIHEGFKYISQRNGMVEIQ